MGNTGNSNVIPLEKGAMFETKRMEAHSATILPRHKASIESVLVVVAGECILTLNGTDRILKQGDSAVIPADEWHQITAHPEFGAIHIMPMGIRFEFAK